MGKYFVNENANEKKLATYCTTLNHTSRPLSKPLILMRAKGGVLSWLYFYMWAYQRSHAADVMASAVRLIHCNNITRVGRKKTSGI